MKDDHESNSKDDIIKRLTSIHFDSTTFLKRTIEFFHRHETSETNSESDHAVTLRWPVVSNERCGNWYAYPYTSATSAHFKSTDGHKNVHNFALKRLNLPFLRTVCLASENNGAVLIVDSSKYKVQPDSFSATLPIWCAVLNGLIDHYRYSLSSVDIVSTGHDRITSKTHISLSSQEILSPNLTDLELHTPPCISQERHNQIKSILYERIQSALNSKVILDPSSFLESAPSKPMRCFWIHHDSNSSSHDEEIRLQRLMDEIIKAQSSYSCIVCINCSDSKRGKVDIDYIPGAGDDEESWSMGLTASLFWENVNDLIVQSKKSQQEIEQAIQYIVAKAKCQNEEWFREQSNAGSHMQQVLKVNPCITSYFDQIGASLLYIGSRRAGRPPECWDYFDVIVNVTTVEYDQMSDASEGLPKGKLYLQLPVREGKRDRSELENWMAVAMLFIGVNLVQDKRILIHCAQGMDRSVAVAISVLCLFYRNFYGTCNENVMNLHNWCRQKLSYASFEEYLLEEEGIHLGDHSHEEASCQSYLKSGIPLDFVTICKGKEGRDLFLRYLKRISNFPTVASDHDDDDAEIPQDGDFFATKETLRLALIKIQQYRPKACPTRNTMQKLNRFFMSSFYEK